MFKFILILGLLFNLGFIKKSELQTFHITGNTQGTTYQVTYYAKNQSVNKKEIELLLEQLDNSLSIYKPNSLINQFNESKRGIIMDKYLKDVVINSLEIYKNADGDFDFTVYPLVRAWGFGTKKIDSTPDAATIKDLLQCVGSDKIKVVKDSLIKTKSCVKIDVNGIAQGYSVDVLASFLDRKKIKNYLVEIGGEIIVKGTKPNGKQMQIGIEAPANSSYKEQFIQKIIQLKGGAITTSGNYRKFITSGTHKYPHLINPKTGYPLENQMISATVIAKDAITADGYDNALMAMTPAAALKFVEDQSSMEAYLIYKKADETVADTATVGFYKLLITKPQ
ncbi:thiamine biosynthesis lipoprotein [Pedobacter sp. CG_S7]|uniref:FAD:protein FMN transferase n=1 Tax=Pedobacter sp. CG_S7 TaxID=3143930 RepID=UPI00339818B3